MSLSKLAVLVAITTASGVSHAGDSTWLLCKGIGERGAKAPLTRTHFVASLLEHRGAGGERDLAVTLIYGDRVSRGEIVGKQAGDFQVKATALKVSSVTGKKPVTFTGTAQLAEDMSTFALTGKIDFTFGDDPKAAMVPFVAKLTCTTLDDLAIGH